MSTITDETLMAYSDGELDERNAIVVRAALEHDDGLRARLQNMRNLDDVLRASFQPRLETPGRFAQLLAGKEPTQVISLRSKSNALRNWIPTGTGIAAAVLILFAGNAFAPGPMAWLEQVDDGIALAGPVLAAIVSTPSGKHVKQNGLNILPVVSFESADGRLCREVQVDDAKLAARIVACRDIDHDDWCIEAFARMPAQPQTNGYYTAGVPKDPVIDAAYARLGIKNTLTADAERQAMAKNWVLK